MLHALIAVLLFAQAGPLENYQSRDVPTGKLYFRDTSEGKVEWAAQHLARSLSLVETRLERKLGVPFTAIIAPSFSEFQSIVSRLGGGAPDETTRGIAFPAQRVFVARSDIFRSDVAEHPLSVTMTHEVAHLVIDRRSGVRVPRWLDEGIAVWISRGRLSESNESQLSVLARMNGLYRLSTLETSFPPGHVPTSVAYSQSFLLVSYLVERAGEKVLVRLLDGIESGRTTRSLLEEEMGQDLQNFESDFASWVVRRRSVVDLLLLLIASPWTIASLLAVLAIGRSIVKRRRGMKRLAEEDAIEDAREELAPEDLSGPPGPSKPRGLSRSPDSLGDANRDQLP